MADVQGGPSRLEVIPYDQCLRLLEEGRLGRLGGVWDGEPHVVPLNYRWDGSSVICRLDPGTTLQTLQGCTVVFEIDGFDITARTGWSVIVRGRADEIAEPPEAGGAEPEPWAPGVREHRVRIVPANVSGRRITRPSPLDNQWWRLSASS